MSEPAAVAHDDLTLQYGAYPALYQAADLASIDGQRAYVRVVRIEILLLLLGAAVGSLAAFEDRLAAGLPFVAAAMFLAAALIKLVTRERRYDKTWFDGRAVAETAKSATWQFMMRVPPYQDDSTAESALVEMLRRTLEARPQLYAGLTPASAGTRQISADMRAMRARPLAGRLDAYRRFRLEDQMQWYRSKSVFHRERGARYFWLSLAIEIFALGVAAASFVAPQLARLNALALLAAVATAATAISQLGRHDELSKSYGLAYQELSLIDGIAERVISEDRLAAVVTDAEGAISREHTMWITKGAQPVADASGVLSESP